MREYFTAQIDKDIPIWPRNTFKTFEISDDLTALNKIKPGSAFLLEMFNPELAFKRLRELKLKFGYRGDKGKFLIWILEGQNASLDK